MKNKTSLTAILRYWGGKQNLTKEIIPRLHSHHCYVEPFCGGAAVLFAKQESPVEILNDSNKEITNFYRIAKTNFTSLKQKIDCTLHNRDTHHDATIIYNYPHLFTSLQRAWAVWVLAYQSFSGKLGGSFSYAKSVQRGKTLVNKKRDFDSRFLNRIAQLQIETGDAIEIIPRYDNHDTLFYCDPPYFQADMGHYRNYSKSNFEDLLCTLSNIKGKFLLSSYPSDILSEYINKNQWYHDNIIQTIMTSQHKSKHNKTEVLTSNYNMSTLQPTIFDKNPSVN